MAGTIHRQWYMLRQLRTFPHKVSAPDLHARLINAGYDVDVRTVQRDLQKLSRDFPLVCDDAHKPHGWSFARDATRGELPGMDTHLALAFRLAEGFLEQLMPTASREGLRGHFEQARKVLDDSALGTWSERVAVAPSGVASKPPEIDSEVLAAIHHALLQRRVLIARYRRRAEQQVRAYRLHPLGLVWRDRVGYLLAMASDYEDVLQLALHRFVEAELVPDAACRERPGFRVADYVDAESMGFLLSPERLPLVLRVEAMAGAKLLEAPLTSDQQVTFEPDGTFVLRASVADTVALRAFLLGFGPRCEVVGPAALREEIAALLRAAAERYGGAGGAVG